jgi:hypothetical protein
MRSTGASIAGANDLAYEVSLLVGFSEKHAAALMRIGLLTVGAHRVVVFVMNVKHLC